MKRYAIKALKGKEYIQSKNDVIDLGSKNLDIHNKIIDLLNKNDFLKNLSNESIYFLIDSKQACFDLESYKKYKIVYGKNNIKLKTI